ncbi:MAG: thioesterase family protein [Euzebya sp.]
MSDSHPIGPGLAGSVTLTVTADDTAVALRSGDVNVLGTPRVLALAEEAACAALKGNLDPGMTSVGVHVELHHSQATAVGGLVIATATLEAVDGRKLDFAFSIREDGVEVAHGTHRRVIARRDAFGVRDR